MYLLHFLWIEQVYVWKSVWICYSPETFSFSWFLCVAPEFGFIKFTLLSLPGPSYSILGYQFPYFDEVVTLIFFLLPVKLRDRSRHPGSPVQGQGTQPWARTAVICKGISFNAFPSWSQSLVFASFPMMIKPSKAPPIYPPEPSAQRANSSNFRPLVTVTLLTITLDLCKNQE